MAAWQARSFRRRQTSIVVVLILSGLVNYVCGRGMRLYTTNYVLTAAVWGPKPPTRLGRRGGSVGRPEITNTIRAAVTVLPSAFKLAACFLLGIPKRLLLGSGGENNNCCFSWQVGHGCWPTTAMKQE